MNWVLKSRQVTKEETAEPSPQHPKTGAEVDLGLLTSAPHTLHGTQSTVHAET